MMSSVFLVVGVWLIAMGEPPTPTVDVAKIKNRLGAAYRGVGGRARPDEPVERDSLLNQRANAELSDEDRAEWCAWIQEWSDRELDRTAKAKKSQEHLRFAFEVLYNVTTDARQESLASICWMRLTRDAAANGEIPPGTLMDPPKWPIAKWAVLPFDPGMKGTISEVVRAAYRSTRPRREMEKEPGWPRDPIELDFKKTIAVAEMLGSRKDEWLRWGLEWAKREYTKGQDFRAYYAMPAEFIYNLADSNSLAEDASEFWRTAASPQSLSRGMPIIVRCRKVDGKERLTWLATECFDRQEAMDFNKGLEPSERVVRKSFALQAECWCDPSVESLAPYLRGRPAEKR